MPPSPPSLREAMPTSPNVFLDSDDVESMGEGEQASLWGISDRNARAASTPCRLSKPYLALPRSRRSPHRGRFRHPGLR